MGAREVSWDELVPLLPEGSTEIVRKWVERGDGVAGYQNVAMDSRSHGDKVFVSFGSRAAQLEAAEPPGTLPDIAGREPGWKYRLFIVHTPRLWPAASEVGHE